MNQVEKMRPLIQPEVVIERVGMDEDQRGPIAADLVPDVDPVGAAVRHGPPQTLALSTAVGN